MTLLPLFVAVLGQGNAVPGQISRLNLVASGGARRLGYYRPHQLLLTPAQPVGIRRLPPGLSNPLFAQLAFGGRTVSIVVDQPEGKPSRLFVDSNGDGDLTNDPAPQWKASPGRGPYSTFMGSAMINAEALGPVSLSFYRFDPRDPQRAKLKNTLLYFRDYVATGLLTIDGNVYNVMLSDEDATGKFATPNLTLLVDRHQSKRFSDPDDAFPAGKPFNLSRTTYEIADVSPDASMLRLVKSNRHVAATPLAPTTASFTPGKTALPFQAVTTGGQNVSFPASYHGKVVMLDFWATWCGPCVGELPNVKKAYDQFHDKGFEILSISLDQKGDGPKLAAFTAENHMPWNQVYDGGFWNARVAKLYGVQAIPFVILVDGDTGRIIADESTLRGPQISDTIGKALQTKAR